MNQEIPSNNIEQMMSKTSKRFVELLRNQGKSVVVTSEKDFKSNPKMFLQETKAIAVSCVSGDQRSPDMSSWLKKEGYTVVTPIGSGTTDFQDRGRFEVQNSTSGQQLTFEQRSEKKKVDILVFTVKFVPDSNSTFSEGDNILAGAATLLSGTEIQDLQIILVDTEQ